jgi:hypothetical protein
MFFDISKAFDRVWHAGLIYKLQKIGIRGPLLKCFKSYLSDRKQKVAIGKGGSATRIHNWPLLFLIFINDIVDEIQCNIRLFADDTSLYIVVKDAYEAAIKLNTDTEKIYE